jgi:hypothetical protein
MPRRIPPNRIGELPRDRFLQYALFARLTRRHHLPLYTIILRHSLHQSSISRLRHLSSTSHHHSRPSKYPQLRAAWWIALKLIASPSTVASPYRLPHHLSGHASTSTNAPPSTSSSRPSHHQCAPLIVLSQSSRHHQAQQDLDTCSPAKWLWLPRIHQQDCLRD